MKADEKEDSIKRERRRVIQWQIAIFTIAFLINFIISYRGHFIIEVLKNEKDSGIMYSINLCMGIGFLILGNIYDNVQYPKRLTSTLLVLISFICFLVNIPSL